MKTLIATGVCLWFAALASAANLNVNLTGSTPVFTTDANWITPPAGSTTSTSFTGVYFPTRTATGTRTEDLVDTTTGNVLWVLAIAFSPTATGNENFSVNATKLNDTTKPTAGAIIINATGSPVQYISNIPGVPSNITGDLTANSTAPAATPEPATFALVGLGTAALFLTRRYSGSKSS